MVDGYLEVILLDVDKHLHCGEVPVEGVELVDGVLDLVHEDVFLGEVLFEEEDSAAEPRVLLVVLGFGLVLVVLVVVVLYDGEFLVVGDAGVLGDYGLEAEGHELADDEVDEAGLVDPDLALPFDRDIGVYLVVD